MANGSLGLEPGEGGVEYLGLHELSLSSFMIMGAILKVWRVDAEYAMIEQVLLAMRPVTPQYPHSE